MVGPVGPLPTSSREPGQARRGAAAAVTLCAGVWLAGFTSITKRHIPPRIFGPVPSQPAWHPVNLIVSRSAAVDEAVSFVLFSLQGVSRPVFCRSSRFVGQGELGHFLRRGGQLWRYRCDLALGAAAGGRAQSERASLDRRSGHLRSSAAWSEHFSQPAVA